jgi:single-strand DNA-binding protein
MAGRPTFNRIILVGNLGREPEKKSSREGTVCTLWMVTNDGLPGKTKENWHRITLFKKHAENALKYLHKGAYILVEGILTWSSWRDSHGQQRHDAEVIGSFARYLPTGGKDEHYDDGVLY